ncbi:hypothetical protein B0H13DRAFT_2322008 [Mycena leptocephala]|nr:hypothetical protein B0H13DRAFT_2322008 [Mycena leptocephala]
MSPDRLRTRVLNLSPRQPRAKRPQRQLPRADPEITPMDIDNLDNSAGPSDARRLPQFMPDAITAEHLSPDSDRGFDAVTDQMPIRAMPTAADSQLYNPESAADLRDAAHGAREGVWSNKHRVTMEDEEEDDPDAAMYMDADLGEEDDGLEGEEDFWGDEDQYYDEYEELYGLPAAEELTEEDLAILRAFALKTEDHLTNATFEKLPYTFPTANIQTLKVTKARIEFLAEFKPVAYDCCPGSCCCYVGPHANEQKCPYCNEPRFEANGRPRKTFTYVPLIPRLVAYFKNSAAIEQMSYRGKYKPSAKMKDFFDGANYRVLRDRFVTVNGQKMSYKFFCDVRDIALGLSTDGFAPFKRRKKT